MRVWCYLRKKGTLGWFVVASQSDTNTLFLNKNHQTTYLTIKLRLILVDLHNNMCVN